MHTSKIALCVLGCLVAQEAVQGVEAVSMPKSDRDSTGQLAFSQKVGKHKPIVSLPPPENLQLQQFTSYSEITLRERNNNHPGFNKLSVSRSIASPESIVISPSNNRLAGKEFKVNKTPSEFQVETSFTSDSFSPAPSTDLTKSQSPQLASELAENNKNFSVQTFGCGQLSGTYTTVLAGTKTPLIRWRSQEFSQRGYTPERRCKSITSKLNRVVSENDNKLSGLWLTMGKVNRYRVLCSVNSTRSGCNKNNLLMTLSYWNRWKPEEVIARLLNFAVATRGYSVQESAEQTYLSLEQWVKQRLEAANDPKLSAADARYWEGVLADDLGEP